MSHKPFRFRIVTLEKCCEQFAVNCLGNQHREAKIVIFCSLHLDLVALPTKLWLCSVVDGL